MSLQIHIPESISSGLNPPQQEAVSHIEGPLLVLAGAGSGKTRVLAYRTAYLVHSGIARPYQILALTFTNKAAGELRSRTTKIVGTDGELVVAGTFHSIFARILRQEGRNIGVPPSFTIVDADDRHRLLKSILKDQNIGSEVLKPGQVDCIIGQAKNNLTSPDDFEARASREVEHLVARIYRIYQERLKCMEGLDFDDLLMRPNEAFRDYPEFLERLQNRFKFVMVDEFQDTNPAQYRLVKLIAAQHRNICVVGDDDQAIYGWRGATVANILDFQRDWKDAKVVRLEQNYRSHKNILDIAWAVISNNPHRHEKKLWTTRETGPHTLLIQAPTDDDEARRFVSFIQDDARSRNRSLNDFAILYRTNAQSLPFERTLRSAGIPYQLIGGLRFYERKEVKDLLAYLRIMVNPADDVSFQRIVNYPPRGIGDSVVNQITQQASHDRITFFASAQKITSSDSITNRQKNALLEFFSLIDFFTRQLCSNPLMTIVTDLVDRIKLKQRLAEEEKDDRSRADTKVANIIALIDEIARYETDNDEPSLAGFLEQVSLVTDIDRFDESKQHVNLMTIHSAKGLEFPVVLVGGLEEGLLPLLPSDGSQADLEEERRLFYVAVTRAKDQVVLGYAIQRLRWGDIGWWRGESRFIKEIPPPLLITPGRRTVTAQPHRPRTILPEPSSPARTLSDTVTPDDLRRGLLVRHAKFGLGQVTNVRKAGLDTRFDVDFDDVGKKTLVLRYAPIEIVK